LLATTQNVQHIDNASYLAFSVTFRAGAFQEAPAGWIMHADGSAAAVGSTLDRRSGFPPCPSLAMAKAEAPAEQAIWVPSLTLILPPRTPQSFRRNFAIRRAAACRYSP
jgi:hypothetical protein